MVIVYLKHKQYCLILCGTSRLSVSAVKLTANLPAGRQGRRDAKNAKKITCGLDLCSVYINP